MYLINNSYEINKNVRDLPLKHIFKFLEITKMNQEVSCRCSGVSNTMIHEQVEVSAQHRFTLKLHLLKLNENKQ